MELKYPIQYKEDKYLGHGSYGVVTLGYDSKNDIKIAIKKVFIKNSNPEEIENHQKECLLMENIRHENIIKYYGSTKND